MHFKTLCNVSMSIEKKESLWKSPKKLKNSKVTHGIWEVLYGKEIIAQMVENIKNEEVKSVLLSRFNNGVCTLKQAKKEIKIYNDSFDKLSDEELMEFNALISKYKLLPSCWLKELATKNEILSKDPEIRKLMGLSLQNNIRPSIIKDGESIYERFAAVENPEEKDLILYYLQEWCLPKLVEEEYENYKDIVNYEYKDENLKQFLLSLIKDEKISPSLIELYFDIIKDKEFWEETENFIRRLINQPKK